MDFEGLIKKVKEDEAREHPDELSSRAQNYAKIRESVFTEMIERGKKKEKNYKPFIKGIRAVKYFPELEERGIFLENYYVALRYIDDVVDGDLELPKKYTNTVEYVQEKINFIKSGRAPEDEIEELLVFSFEVGAQFGADFQQESLYMLNPLLFDAKRRNDYTIFDEKTLHSHFYTLDIKGCIKASLKVFGENPDFYEVLEPLGEAERIYYNLRDFNEDVEAGLVNISSEDCTRLGITIEILRSGSWKNNKAVHTWFQEQANKGLEFFKKYQYLKRGVNFKLGTQVALKLGFEIGAKRFLENVAKGKFEKILK